MKKPVTRIHRLNDPIYRKCAGQADPWEQKTEEQLLRPGERGEQGEVPGFFERKTHFVNILKLEFSDICTSLRIYWVVSCIL